jgi:orotate phosphoribosyltransferase
MRESEVLETFRRTGGLLEGHFELRSGLHSDRYFQCALVLQYPVLTARLCGALVERLRAANLAEGMSVVAPAMGGLFVGHEIARALEARSIFAEKEEGRLVLRRGFRVAPGERFIVAEDVVTRGGRVRETIGLVRAAGGTVTAVAALVDRSGGTADFGVPFFSLLRLAPTTWSPADCPLCREGRPVEHPGS